MTFFRSLVTVTAVTPAAGMLFTGLSQALTSGGLVLPARPAPEIANWAMTTGMIIWLAAIVISAVLTVVDEAKKALAA